MSKSFLIWSNYHNAWYRKNAYGYTSSIESAGVFKDRSINEEKGEIKIYIDDKHPLHYECIIRDEIRSEIKYHEEEALALESLEKELNED